MIFNYLVDHCGVQPNNIILFGRSIGSGPATWLAAKKEVCALVLISAFTSIQNIVKSMIGNFAKKLVKNHF